MSKQPSDSFLPSGAIDSPRKFGLRPDSTISPLSIPRSIPDYMPSPHSGSTASPNTFRQSRSPSQHLNGPPISPPKTRSASADDGSAALVEDWRIYTQKLRSQSEGERAHMAADRARMEEVMEEERALWDREREILKARIAELEELLEKKGSIPWSPPSVNHRVQATNSMHLGSNEVSSSSSVDGAAHSVPQESGRNADGSPFYAPAPRNPSRTFNPSEMDELRVDDITTPRETPIRVTSKELTSSDFRPQNSSASISEAILAPEATSETIDISQIQPGLDGVAIKVTAVSPTFAAKVLTPQFSPPKLSPDAKPPQRDTKSMLGSPVKREKESKEIRTLEAVSQPENRRLVMHAGHTPNHSISKFPFLQSESGGVTPTQEHHDENTGRRFSLAPTDNDEAPEKENGRHEEHQGEETEDEIQVDRELTGPLGLTNQTAKDERFLEQLNEKLEEVRKSADASPSNESSSSTVDSTLEEVEDEADKEPKLKLKPSLNFGAPYGRL